MYDEQSTGKVLLDNGRMTPLAGWQSSPTQPTTPAPFDVHLVGKNNVEVAQAVVAKLKDAYHGCTHENIAVSMENMMINRS